MTSSVPSLGVFGATHTVRLLSFQKNSNIFLFLPQCAPRQGKNTSSQLRGGHHAGHLLGIELLSWLVSYCVVLPSVICSLPQLLHGHPGGHNHNSAVLSLLYQVRWGKPIQCLEERSTRFKGRHFGLCRISFCVFSGSKFGESRGWSPVNIRRSPKAWISREVLGPHCPIPPVSSRILIQQQYKMTYFHQDGG